MKLEVYFQTIVSNVPYGAFLKDKSSNYILVNRAYAEELGFPLSEFAGKSDRHFLSSAEAEMHEMAETDIWESGKTQYDEEQVVLDGREQWVGVTRSLVNDPAGRPVALLGILFDLGVQKAKEAELQRAKKALDEFVYVVSHDLQEPLRMVRSFSELLAERYGGQLDEKADMYIDYAVDGARRMQEMIADLLAFSRIATRRSQAEMVDCADVLDEALRSLDVAIKESGADIKVGHLPQLVADHSQLVEVFEQLVGNSLKFSGEVTPLVEISARQSGSFWEFCIQDNGIGVDPKFHERIFVIFQRLHERGRYEGRGVGLAFAKRIIELHGGNIRIDSIGGSGSRFLFTLPAS